MKKVLEWVLNNIIALVDIIGTIGIGIYAFITKKQHAHNFSVLEIALLVILFLQFFVVVLIVVKNFSSYKSYHYSWFKIKPQCIFLEKIAIYKRDNNDVLNFKRKAVLKGTKDDNRITDKFIWTGNNPASIPIKGKNVQEIREQKERKGVWKFFDIILDKQLRKGKVREISYNWKPILNCSSSSPFVSQSTEEPTKLLRFEIDLGVAYANKEIILEEYRAIDANVPLNEIEGQKFDDNGKYVWKIKKPKRFRYYIARWEWHNTTAPTAKE